MNKDSGESGSKLVMGWDAQPQLSCTFHTLNIPLEPQGKKKQVSPWAVAL